MVAICPVNAKWVHEFIVTPIDEGLRRLNLVFAPFNFYSFNRTPLTLKDRLLFLIAGTALVLFPINVIVWVAWQTFGHPKRLSPRYCPES
jgi:hypothetical protein